MPKKSLSHPVRKLDQPAKTPTSIHVSDLLAAQWLVSRDLLSVPRGVRRTHARSTSLITPSSVTYGVDKLIEALYFDFDFAGTVLVQCLRTRNDGAFVVHGCLCVENRIASASLRPCLRATGEMKGERERHKEYIVILSYCHAVETERAT